MSEVTEAMKCDACGAYYDAPPSGIDFDLPVYLESKMLTVALSITVCTARNDLCSQCIVAALERVQVMAQ